MGVGSITRTLVVALGCAGVLWGLITLPAAKRNADAGAFAAQIIRGSVFQTQQLREQIPALEAIEGYSLCQVPALRSDMVIRLRLTEVSFNTADLAHLDSDLAAARAAIRRSLSCSPTDAYGWLALFWMNAVTQGFKPDDLALLRMSYREGPNEGWIILIRNHLALALYPALPPDLAELTLADFVKTLQPEFVVAGVENFIGPGWPIHDLLLERIKDIPEAQRQRFAEILVSKGYDVNVPGIVRGGPSAHRPSLSLPGSQSGR